MSVYDRTISWTTQAGDLLNIAVHKMWSAGNSQRRRLTASYRSVSLPLSVRQTVTDSVLFDTIISYIEIEDYKNGVLTLAETRRTMWKKKEM
jgi:hypothetical protein